MSTPNRKENYEDIIVSVFTQRAHMPKGSPVSSTIRPAQALLATAALLASLAAAPAPGHAAPAYNRQVLVTNLLNPRGLTVDSIGRVLVSEGGAGGTNCTVAGAPPSPPPTTTPTSGPTSTRSPAEPARSPPWPACRMEQGPQTAAALEPLQELIEIPHLPIPPIRAACYHLAGLNGCSSRSAASASSTKLRLYLELLFQDRLQGDLGVIGAGQAEHVLTLQALEAHHLVDQGDVEGMAHGQARRT